MIEAHIIEAISNLTHAVHEWHREWKHHVEHQGSGSQAATKQDLANAVNQIMSAISEFSAKQGAFNDRIDAAVSGLADDVAGLKADILALQNSAGQITPEDQALLDGIQTRTDGIATKLEALDALTPPKPPVA